VCTLEGFDGFYFLPEAVGVRQQRRLVQAALVDCPEPPNRTSHSVAHGHLPGLWAAAGRGLLLRADMAQQDGEATVSGGSEAEAEAEAAEAARRASGGKARSSRWCEMGPGDDPRGKRAAASLLRTLRWATVGTQFDWNKQGYHELEGRPVPAELAALAEELALEAAPHGARVCVCVRERSE
jgi:hypothetical protein